MDPLTAGLLVGGAVLSAGSSYLSGVNAAKMSKAQFNTSMKFNEKWNEKNYEQTEYWNKYAYDYANPVNQRKRLEAAGLNPALMLDQFSTGFQGSPDTQSASMSAPAAGMFHMPDPVASAAGSLASTASAFAQLSQSKNTDAQTERIKSLLAGEIEAQGLDNQAKEMANDIVKKYGYAQASENLAKTAAEVSKIWADYDLAIKNGEYTDELRNKTIEEAKRITEEAGLKKKEADYLQKQIDWYDKRAQQDISESKSRQYANTASGNASNAAAKLYNEQERTQRELTRKEHWNRVAASWNALDSKTTAMLNKKFGSIDRMQNVIDKEIDQFVKSNNIANPSDMLNMANKIWDGMLKKIGLNNYNGIDRKKAMRDLHNYVIDRLYEEYDFDK